MIRITVCDVFGFEFHPVLKHAGFFFLSVKPHRKKKSFISKKNAVSFHLVHRSQKDPLAADEKAPQHVLLPAAKVRQTCE